jgi:hypothetical protein
MLLSELKVNRKIASVSNEDYRPKVSMFDKIAECLSTGRMLDPSAAENQLSSISTFHPVSRIQGTTSTLQPVINGADLHALIPKEALDSR